MNLFKPIYKNPKVSLILIALTFFIIISSILQLFTNAISTDYIPSDSYGYIKAAKVLYHEFELHPTGQMVYSFFSGFPLVFNSEPLLGQMIVWNYVLNFVLWIGTILILYKALQLQLSKKFALLLSLFFILCVGNIAQLSVILTETLTCFLVTAIGYQLLLFYIKKSNLNLVYAVALMNLVVLVRPGMLFLAIIFMMFFLGYQIKFRTYVTSIQWLLVIISGTMIFLQAFSNYNNRGNFTVSYIDKHAWYLYIGAEASADSKNIPFLEERNLRRHIFNPLPFKEQYQLAKSDFKSQISSHPNLIFKNFISNIHQNIVVGNLRISKAKDFHNFPYFNYLKYYLYLLSKAQNIVLSFLALILGTIILLRFRSWSMPLLLSCSIPCYIIITSGVSFWEGDRFNLVFYPMVLILFSYKLKEWSWFAKEKE